MYKEPRPPQEMNLNPVELQALVDELLNESSQYNVDCLDLKEVLVHIVIEWFVKNKDELEQNFKDFYPQTYPPKQELLNRIRHVLPLGRIHVDGVGLEFRRTQIIDHWVGEIYNKLLNKIFKQERS